MRADVQSNLHRTLDTEKAIPDSKSNMYSLMPEFKKLSFSPKAGGSPLETRGIWNRIREWNRANTFLSKGAFDSDPCVKV